MAPHCITLGSPNPQPCELLPDQHHHQRRRLLYLTLFLLLVLFLTAAAIAVFLARSRARDGGESGDGGISAMPAPTRAISDACASTRFPDLCVSSLVGFPGVADASEGDLAHVSINMTLGRVGAALYAATAFSAAPMSRISRAAYDDCVELLGSSLDQLSRSLLRGGADDVINWLSAAMTNLDTCEDGIGAAAADIDNGDVGGGNVEQGVRGSLKDLAELLSNSLAIFAAEKGSEDDDDFAGVPVQNKRRLLSPSPARSFPSWVRRRDRWLMDAPAGEIQADMVVAKDGGNGSYYTSIATAVRAAPSRSRRRIVIYVKAGRYVENVKVGRKKTNLMFVGDGQGVTVVSGSRSVADHYTTFQTATFAATGSGFMMRNMTVENTAGPERHQAVALRVGADRAVVYRCSITGYQDTLYAHSQRQFYRECDISGTVDFVFGNAAAVLQNCTLWSCRPLAGQKNTVTAQGRKEANQNTGFSLHNCRILNAAGDVGAPAPTYLGRPWKAYSRVVYMMSEIGEHVVPEGWLEWDESSAGVGFAPDTLYYGEYMNYGAGAAVRKRVAWPGFRVITVAAEAEEFTVARFISGSKWLPADGVSFVAGLSV